MDTTKTITHVSLCAGYGGIDLGLKRAIPNLRTIAFSEIEAFACANLVSKMEAGLLDAAPIWTNLKTFPWGKFRGVVDILSGGYPCQPFSAAGKRLGTEDPRHLWPYIADGIAAMRPSVCFFENVEGHISLGLPDVIEDLGRLGYRTTWGIFSASEVGAPHQRKRVFIMAHRKCEGLERWGCGLQPESNRRGTPNNTWEGRNLLAHTMCNGGREGREVRQGADGAIPVSNGEPRGAWPNRASEGASMADSNPRGCSPSQHPRSSTEEDSGRENNPVSPSRVWPSRPGQPQHSWEPPRVVENPKLIRRGRWSDGDEGRVRGEIQVEGSRSALGNSEGGCNGQFPPQQQRGNPFRGSSEEGSMGNAASLRPCGGGEDGGGEQPEVSRTGSEYSKDQRKTEPSMGGDPNGTSYRVGHAELYVTCDNRTDELRLLGNGVVPATAELAWTTLLKELTNL